MIHSRIGKQGKHPWSPAEATTRINHLASLERFVPSITEHAMKQMKERDILMGDLLYLLKKGFVFREGMKSSRKIAYKYQIEGRTPNSGRRRVGAIVAVSEKIIKIITVMWVDEPVRRG